MAAWKHKINVAKEWKQAENDEITVHELAKYFATKLKALPCYDEDFELFEIVGWFNDIATDQTLTVEDFDETLYELYNWADCNKNCWIERISCQ